MTSHSDEHGDLEPPLRGYEPDASKLASAYWLGAGILLLAVFSLIPVGVTVARHSASDSQLALSRWVYLVVVVAVLLMAYAVYIVQLPDWGTAWAVTVVILLIAAGYAMMLTLTLLAGEGNQLLALLQLDRADFAGGQQVSWYLVMTMACSLFAYFSGRLASRWHRSYKLVALLKLKDMP